MTYASPQQHKEAEQAMKRESIATGEIEVSAVGPADIWKGELSRITTLSETTLVAHSDEKSMLWISVKNKIFKPNTTLTLTLDGTDIALFRGPDENSLWIGEGLMKIDEYEASRLKATLYLRFGDQATWHTVFAKIDVRPALEP